MRRAHIGFLTLLWLAAAGCASSNPQPVAATLPLPGSSAVAGRVLSSDPACGSVMAQVAFVSGGATLYQTTVPPNGTFEFQANPGTYTLVAQSGSCAAQQTI